MNQIIQKVKSIPTECYSRVAGYFRPVTQWNKGKQSEFEDRQVYDTPTIQDLKSMQSEIKNTLKIEKSKGNEDAGFLIERL